jgi:hypothetical protein
MFFAYERINAACLNGAVCCTDDGEYFSTAPAITPKSAHGRLFDPPRRTRFGCPE